MLLLHKNQRAEIKALHLGPRLHMVSRHVIGRLRLYQGCRSGVVISAWDGSFGKKFSPRIYDLLLLWGRTRIPALYANLHNWKASSYSPLVVDPPDARGRRRNADLLPRLWVRGGRP